MLIQATTARIVRIQISPTHQLRPVRLFDVQSWGTKKCGFQVSKGGSGCNETWLRNPTKWSWSSLGTCTISKKNDFPAAGKMTGVIFELFDGNIRELPSGKQT